MNLIRIDVSCLQIGTYFKTYIESEARNDAVVCFEIIENANEISRSAVEKDEYENY